MSNPKYAHIGGPMDKCIEESAELIEELTKLIKAICKARRFGWKNYHPDRPESNNIKEVHHELKDVGKMCIELDSYLKVLYGE